MESGQKRAQVDSPFTTLLMNKRLAMSNPSIVNSPIRAPNMTESSRFSPLHKVSSPIASAAHKENIDNDISPSPPSRKKKFQDSGNSASASWGMKTKRLKKLAKQLPDNASIDDILRLQEDLNEHKEKVNALQEKNTSLQQQIDQHEQETSDLMREREQLQLRVKEEQKIKDSLLSEVTGKTSELRALEQQKEQVCRELAEEKEKVRRAEETIRRMGDQHSELQRRFDLMDSALKDNSVELLLKKQEQKELMAKCEDIKVQREYILKRLQDSSTSNDQLQAKLAEEGSMYKSSINVLQDQMEKLKKEYFFSTALAVKLNLSGSKENVQSNVVIQTLFENAIRDAIPLDEWPKWITSNF